jgi:hypothetical protein
MYRLDHHDPPEKAIGDGERERERDRESRPSKLQKEDPLAIRMDIQCSEGQKRGKGEGEREEIEGLEATLVAVDGH